MSGGRVLLVVAPLRLTFWVLVIGMAMIGGLIAFVVARHLEHPPEVVAPLTR